MIAWTKTFPKRERFVGYYRLLKARHRFYDTLGLTRGKHGMPRIGHRGGYQRRLAMMRDKQKDRRCFIIANGPSLKQMDLSALRREITIGCNGIYSAFPEWGFHTSYLMFEDIEQTELRRHDIHAIEGPMKLASIYNAYSFKADQKTVFFNSPRMRGHNYYWTELYPQFSRDFASLVHLGSSVTYIMIQFAYHLGCNPVYVIGLDHSYGELAKRFPVGKVKITEENIDLVRGLHFSDKYYKVGDQIGVPDVPRQEQAYTLARKEFEAVGRNIYNAGLDSKLDLLEKVDFESIFNK